jgi:hypothetical protein
MTMNIDDPSCLDGATVISVDGQKLGSVDAVYFDNASDRPQWVAVRGGLFGTRVALVPLRRAAYADEADLYRYYGLDYAADESARTVEFRIDSADLESAEDAGRARLRRHDAGLRERRSL